MTTASWEAAIGGLSTAHPSLPIGAKLLVTGARGSAVVKVEDHGPESWTGRGLDLSPAAFRVVVGPLAQGVGPVRYEVLLPSVCKSEKSAT